MEGPDSESDVSKILDAFLVKLDVKDGPSVHLGPSDSFSSAQLKQLEHKLLGAVSSVRTLRNLSVPINRLPPEVLFIIFSMLQTSLPSFMPVPSSGSYGDNFREWLSLLHVCRNWRDVAISYPSLWATIDNGSATETCLQRSLSAPLTVYLGIREPAIPRALVESLVSHTARFQQFHINVNAYNSNAPLTVFQTLSSPAPSLESLTVITDRKFGIPSALPTLFVGQTRLLRQLTLEHFTSWPGNRFDSLTHLCLFDQCDEGRSTTAQFLDVLDSSPCLEELVLVQAGPTCEGDGDSPAPSPDRLVDLSKLRELNIGEWPSGQLIARFLSHLIIPRETNMYLWGDHLLLENEDLTTLIPPNSSRLANLNAAKGLYFIRQTTLHLSVPLLAVVDSVIYMYGSFLPSQVLPALSRGYPLDTIEHLRIRDNYKHPNRLPLETWKLFLDATPSIHTLSVFSWNSPRTTRAILTALRPRETQGGGKVIPPCPLLQTLRIEDDPSLPTLLLVTFAEERLTLQCPLQKLSITTWDRTEDDEEDHDDDDVPKIADDLLSLEKYITVVDHEEKEPGLAVVIPLSWPNAAFVWTRRRRDQ